MILTENLGKKVRLSIVKKVDFGVYLGDSQDKVLLPKKQVPKGAEPGIWWRCFYIRIPLTV